MTCDPVIVGGIPIYRPPTPRQRLMMRRETKKRIMRAARHPGLHISWIGAMRRADQEATKLAKRLQELLES